MHRFLSLAALALVVVTACKKDEPAPAAAPAPAPIAAPGGTAPAPMPAPVPAAPTQPADCPELRLALSPAALAYSRGSSSGEVPRIDGAIDADETRNALAGLAAQCIGPVVLVVTDDVRYQDAIAVLELARLVEFRQLGIDQAPRNPPPGASADVPVADLAKQLVVAITPTEVKIGPVALPLDDKLQAAVTTAVTAAAAGTPKGGFILQADAATPGKVVNAVIRGVRSAGYTDVLFAVQRP